MKKILCAISLVISFTSLADCVYGAKNKTKYVVLDNHSIILKGGYGNDILIKTFAFVSSSSNVMVLKDSFCSYDNSVLYIDGGDISESCGWLKIKI